MPSALRNLSEPNSQQIADELQPGTRLLQGQFIIDAFLNSGGFGITYLARNALNRRVVIKECFPEAFCVRSNSVVIARSRAQQAEFRSVVKQFVHEAFSLSKLAHPNIVAVHQVFEDNDTAYMSMDYIDGPDLLDTLEEGAERLRPEQITHILTQILAAVGFIHSKGVLHRDISPDNILLDKATGNPVLIDFGAAREQDSKAGRGRPATRMVKDGYSPKEFYVGGSAEGPSSDLYSLGATFYHLIAGHAPANAQLRLAAVTADLDDPYVPLVGKVSGYPVAFLETIDRAMNLFPEDRIASAEEWLAMLGPNADKAARQSRHARRQVWPRLADSAVVTVPAKIGRSLQAVLAASAAVIALAASLVLFPANQMSALTANAAFEDGGIIAITDLAAVLP